MGEGSSNLDWLSTSESQALANTFATSFDIGIDLIGIQKTGKGKKIVKGVAFADANAVSDASAIANSEDDFVAFAFSGAEANAASSSTAVGLKNSGKLHTGKGRDVIRGISFANSLAGAGSLSNATAASEFGLAVAIAESRASAYADAFSVGVHNAHKAVIKTKSGGDAINGRAFANANAAAVTDTRAFVAGILAESQANVNKIDVATSLTVLGINNSGKLKTGPGGDRISGVAIGNGAAWANAATTVAVAIADAAASANATAKVSSRISTIAIGINNGGKQGLIKTGRGHDTVTGIGIVDNASTVANASAVAQAKAKSAASNAITFSTAKTDTITAIGINNDKGLIKLDAGKDTLIAYGSSYGLLGGRVDLGIGDDILHAGIIKNANSNGQVTAFAQEQTGALENVRVMGGKGNDTFILHSLFGNNALLRGDAGFDQLTLPGNIDQYDISLGSKFKKEVLIGRNGASLTVQNVEQFHIGNQTLDFTDLASA